jgi:hypothetical protein
MSLWNLLPAALVTRAKAVVAAAAAVLYTAVSFIPSLAGNHYVAIVIGLLTALGVWAVPSSNARTAALRKQQLAGQYRDHAPTPPSGYYAPSVLATPDEVRERIYDLNRAPGTGTFSSGTVHNVNITGASGIGYSIPGTGETVILPPEETPGEPG